MTRSSSDWVLTTPELVALLANTLRKKDLVNLARASRSCFGTTIGYVWREVRGVHNLFMLIPETKYENVRSRKLRIPDLATADLSRFNFYAPCVSRLEILPGLHENYRFSDWDKLDRYAKSAVLLPNLRTLVFEFARSKDETFVRWITPFLSSQVLGIYTHSVDWTYEARLSMSVAETLMEAISERCPAITELSLFPVQPFFPPYDPEYEDPTDSGSDFSDGDIFDSEGAYDPNATKFSVHQLASPNDSDDPDNFKANLAKALIVPVRYYDHLKNAHCLRTLTTSSFILDPDALLILGSLPKLEKLDLYCSYFVEDLPCFDSSIIPGHAFPSLRTLRLLLPHMDTVRYIWDTKPLVNRLTNIKIQLQAGVDDYHASGLVSLMSFIPKICARSPNIQEFTLDLDATQGQVHIVPKEMLQALASLPLRNLDLRHALLKNLPQACQILQQCRTLRDLHIQDQKISYEDLLCFSQISSLECLHADVNWTDLQTLQKCRNTTPQRPFSIRFLHCSNPPHLAKDPAAILDVTRLLYVWLPKLEEVSWVGTSMYGVAPGTVDKTYVLVNSILKQIKGHKEEQSRFGW